MTTTDETARDTVKALRSISTLYVRVTVEPEMIDADRVIVPRQCYVALIECGKQAASLIESLTAENANLRDQLDHAGLVLEAYKDDIAASQRRADAAVEDLTKLATRPIAPCHSCSKTCVFPATLAPELQPAPWCRDWEWRGVKEEA